jgi:hypothetical protein
MEAQRIDKAQKQSSEKDSMENLKVKWRTSRSCMSADSSNQNNNREYHCQNTLHARFRATNAEDSNRIDAIHVIQNFNGGMKFPRSLCHPII